MNNKRGTLSIWKADLNIPSYPQLKQNVTSDVCIVGAGITGLTTAYLLQKKGKEVIVVDSGSIGSGETGRTTAHITNVVDDRYSEIINMHGLDNAQLVADSETEAINMIEKIVTKENIDCDFKRVNGYLLFSKDDNTLEEEMEACLKAGVECEHTGTPLEQFKDYQTLRFPRQAQFNAMKYISALSDIITSRGGRIFADTFINDIVDGEVVKIKSANGSVISAGDAVIATNSPVSDYYSIHPKQPAYRTYAMAFSIPPGVYEEALYWDDEEPYHYVRTYDDKKNLFLITGGEDHRTGQEHDPEQRFRSLEEWTREHFPAATDLIYKWSGQVLEPVDGLSYIGKDPENPGHIYIATGDSGMGITHGTYAGMILSDLITGRENKWAELYDPKRITLKSAPEFLGEGINFISQYVDLVTSGEVKSEDEIPVNCGAILKDGIEKYAIYRDENNELHRFSALCTHLKCVLQWNNVEKSWDCPCHGSRFDATGNVLNGPAISCMKKADEKEFSVKS